MTTLMGEQRCSSDPMLDAAVMKTSRLSKAWSNDIEFSGERKRVRCNEGLGGRGFDRLEPAGEPPVDDEDEGAENQNECAA